VFLKHIKFKFYCSNNNSRYRAVSLRVRARSLMIRARGLRVKRRSLILGAMSLRARTRRKGQQVRQFICGLKVRL
jgi:hypothetical protein